MPSAAGMRFTSAVRQTCACEISSAAAPLIAWDGHFKGAGPPPLRASYLMTGILAECCTERMLSASVRGERRHEWLGGDKKGQRQPRVHTPHPPPPVPPSRGPPAPSRAIPQIPLHPINTDCIFTQRVCVLILFFTREMSGHRTHSLLDPPHLLLPAPPNPPTHPLTPALR